jgi:hypothetical protein
MVAETIVVGETHPISEAVYSNSTFSGTNRPFCQVCDKIGHTAKTCYQRFNHAFQNETFNSPQAQAYYSSPTISHDENWYPNISATHHLTSDMQNLTISAEEYGG